MKKSFKIISFIIALAITAALSCSLIFAGDDTRNSFSNGDDTRNSFSNNSGDPQQAPSSGASNDRGW